MLSKARILSTTIFIVIVGYLFLVYTNFTLKPWDSVYKGGSQPVVDWKNASRLEHIAPQVFSETPGRFLLGFKNPCWKEADGRLLCLPYFYLAGMPKCGTTDLWNKLIQHPLIAKCGKEPHWWTRKRIGGSSTEIMPANQYYDRMSHALTHASRASGISKTNFIVGDGSASTLWDNRKWRHVYPNHQEGPPHVIAEVIASIEPSAKVIVILRNPTERLYSDYLVFTNTTMSQLSPRDFHSRVILTLQKWSRCNSHHEQRTCTYFGSSDEGVRIQVGMYSVYIADWLRVIPRNQTLVIRMKDWQDDCIEVLRTLHRFLDINSLTGGQLYEICNQKRANTRSEDKQHIGPMWNETRKLLDQFYDPFNIELANLLKDNRFLWR